MTPAERLLWGRIQRRAAILTPELAAALLVAFAALRDKLSEEEVTRIIEIGLVDRMFEQILTQAAFDMAFQPVRERLRRGLADGIRYFARDIPAPPSKTVAIGFDILNPRVIDAVRRLETKVVVKLQDDVKETLRAFVENGLRDGTAPATIGRQVRSVIGLAPSQEQEVRNFRAALEGKDGRDPFTYQRRDRRFDRTVAGSRESGEPLSAEQVDTMVARYRARRIAWNAETNARTGALDAQKLGQKMSWDEAIEKDIIDGERARQTWVGVMDSKERPEHVAMEGQTVQFGEPFSNGETIPGEDDYNCRCVPRYWLAATANV